MNVGDGLHVGYDGLYWRADDPARPKLLDPFPQGVDEGGLEHPCECHQCSPEPHVFWPQSDPGPQRVHDSEEHPETCGCHWCSPEGKAVFRKVNGIPFERIVIDPRALTFAADEYEASTGHVDEIALGHAILGYLESEAAS